MKKIDRFGSALTNTILAWFPFLVCWISTPLAVYSPNQPAFGHDTNTVFPFIGIGIASFFILYFVFFVRNKPLSKIAFALFYVGLFLLVAEMFAPVAWDILDGEEKLREPFRLSLIEFAILAMILVIILYVDRKTVGSVGSIVVMTFAFSQIIYAVTELESSDKGTPTENQRPAALVKNQNQPNIYHFVFDAYSSLIFEQTVERLKIRDDFSSFVFFKNNLSNYIVTAASVPSFQTGTFYKGGEFTKWRSDSKRLGVGPILMKNGYQTSLYIPNKSNNWFFEGANKVVTSREFALSFFSGSEKFRLAQIVMVRLSPNFLRHETLKVSEKLLGKIVGFVNGVDDLKGLSGFRFYKRLSVPVLERFLKDEQKRPATNQYVYTHVILPHAPHTWSSNCKYIASSNFKQQTDCATSFMATLIKKLKTLKKFDNSLVIIQSDHGAHVKGSGNVSSAYEMPANVQAKFSAANKFFPSKGIAKRVHSLLLVKPPKADAQPLVISTAPSQLLDVPQTIYSAVGLKDVEQTEGRSVLSLTATENRKIHVYSGIYTRNEKGKTQILGRNMLKTTLSHISFEKTQGWKIENDLGALGH